MEAIERSRAALRDTILNGVKTNVPVHVQILDHPVFIKGNYTTRFMGDDFKYKERAASPKEVSMAMIAAAVSAFSREFKAPRGYEDEASLWKDRGRWEALR